MHIQSKPLADVIIRDLSSHKFTVKIKLGADLVPVDVSDLRLDRVPRARAGVVDIECLDLAGRVEGVERDLARALPLGDVNLRWPASGRVEPEGRPGALSHRRDELGTDVVATTRGDREGLLCVDGTGVVVNRVRFAGCRRGGQLEDAVVDGHLLLGHFGATIVGLAPGVVVVPVLVEAAERVGGYVCDGALMQASGHGSDGAWEECRNEEGLGQHDEAVSSRDTS